MLVWPVSTFLDHFDRKKKKEHLRLLDLSASPQVKIICRLHIVFHVLLFPEGLLLPTELGLPLGDLLLLAREALLLHTLPDLDRPQLLETELGRPLVEVLGVHGLLGGVRRLEDGEGHRRPVVLGLQHARLQLEPSAHTQIVYLADNLDPISVFYLQNRYLDVIDPR